MLLPALLFLVLKTTTKSSPRLVVKKKGKELEFPTIDWTSTNKQEIQLCILLYNERIKAYRDMRRYFEMLLADNFDVVSLLVDAQICNTSASDELRHYAQDKTFVYRHPLTIAFRQRLEDEKTLRHATPEEIYRAITNNASYIRKLSAKLANLKTDNNEIRNELHLKLQVAEAKKDNLLQLLKK